VQQRHRTDCTIQSTYDLWTDVDPANTFIGFNADVAGSFANIDDIQATNNVLGTAVWSLAVPTLPGASFYVQSVAFEASANSLGVVLSNAGHGTLGF
jgi:hypothetical protein